MSRVHALGRSCALAAAFIAAGCRPQVEGSRVPTARNLLLVTIDTLRADHLGCYGYARDTTPALDGLARDGIVFDAAYSVCSWTLPSVVSIMTSLYPSAHR